MPATHVEIERKYVLPDGADLPALIGVPDVATVDRRDDDLDADYYDTKNLALVRNRVTLRRRTGGPDAGWHLKTPDADEDTRTEFAVPLQDRVPTELAGYVCGLTRGRSLVEVAHIATQRSALVLRNSAGHTLAEVAVDDVVARDILRGVETAWIEIEVELVDGQPGLLDDIDDLLRTEGARRPKHVSKLAHALGRDDGWKREDTDGRRSAAEALRGYVCAQLDALLAADLRLRTAPDGDAIHDLRVAARRMRSCLAAYRSFFATDTTKLRADLRWIGVALGRERDDQVLLARLDSEFEDEPIAVPANEARELLDAWLGNEIRAAHEDSEKTLVSKRYLRTLDRLARMVEADGFTDAAGAPAAQALIPVAQQNWKRVRHRHSKWRHATDNKDEALHDVRKAAKRARYAFEVLDASGIDVSTKKVRRVVDDLADLQDLLGLHHDMVVTREMLVRLARSADATREAGFTFGRLHKEAEIDAAAAISQYVGQWPITKRHAEAIKPR